MRVAIYLGERDDKWAWSIHRDPDSPTPVSFATGDFLYDSRDAALEHAEWIANNMSPRIFDVPNGIERVEYDTKPVVPPVHKPRHRRRWWQR